VSSPAALTNPRAKLRRADEHLIELLEEAWSFFETEPLGVEYEERGFDLDVAVAVVREEPPLRLGVILGDVLANWRSALDNLAHQLVLLEGNEPTGQTSFPIFRSAADYEGRGRRRIAGMNPTHAEVIEGLQPFQSEDDPTVKALAVLDEYSNVDKHRMVHPSLAVVTDPQAYAASFRREPKDVDDDAFFEVHPVGFGQPLKNGLELAHIRWKSPIPDPKPQISTDLPIAIGLGEKGLSMRSLPTIRWHMSVVVESFAPDFGEAIEVDPSYWDDRPRVKRRSEPAPGRGSS
jgi:hypothetical protein